MWMRSQLASPRSKSRVESIKGGIDARVVGVEAITGTNERVRSQQFHESSVRARHRLYMRCGDLVPHRFFFTKNDKNLIPMNPREVTGRENPL